MEATVLSTPIRPCAALASFRSQPARDGVNEPAASTSQPGGPTGRGKLTRGSSSYPAAVRSAVSWNASSASHGMRSRDAAEATSLGHPSLGPGRVGDAAGGRRSARVIRRLGEEDSMRSERRRSSGAHGGGCPGPIIINRAVAPGKRHYMSRWWRRFRRHEGEAATREEGSWGVMGGCVASGGGGRGTSERASTRAGPSVGRWVGLVHAPGRRRGARVRRGCAPASCARGDSDGEADGDPSAPGWVVEAAVEGEDEVRVRRHREVDERQGQETLNDGLPPLLRMPTWRAALVVGSPVMAMGLLRSGFNLTDLYWAGKLGPTHLSALCYNAFALWMISLACSVVATGVQARVSKCVGARDDAAVAHVVVQGLWGAVMTYAVLLLAAPLIPTLYVRGLGIEPSGVAYVVGRAHLIALIVGSATLCASNVLEAAFRGLGQTRIALVIVACTIALAAVLDPMLMLGVGPFPKLGIVGAATGTAMSVGLGAFAQAAALQRVCGVRLRWAPPDMREISRMVGIGAPLASSGVVFTLVYMTIGRIASGLGENYLAAMGLGQKFEAVAFTVCEGFRLACATLVGQWLGAGLPARAGAAARIAVKTCMATMVPFAIALFTFGSVLVGMISSDPEIVAAAGGYLRWNSGVLVFLAMEAVTEGAFTGAGNTFPVLCIGAACNLARIPVAQYLAVNAGWGISGVWATIAASQVIKALIKSWWFRTRVIARLEQKAEAAVVMGGV